MSEAVKQKGTVVHALLLGAFAMVSAALLAGGDKATRDAIAERRAEDLKASLSQVIADETYDNDLLADAGVVKGLKVYKGTRAGAVTALAYEQSGFGYGGEIRVILGLKADGSILGARVLSHAETPGLGDKIEPAKDDWILGFEGLSLGNPVAEKWAVRKDGGQFDQFSGATITPRAVVAAIKQGLEFFEANRDVLLAFPEVEK